MGLILAGAPSKGTIILTRAEKIKKREAYKISEDIKEMRTRAKYQKDDPTVGSGSGLR